MIKNNVYLILRNDLNSSRSYFHENRVLIIDSVNHNSFVINMISESNRKMFIFYF